MDYLQEHAQKAIDQEVCNDGHVEDLRMRRFADHVDAKDGGADQVEKERDGEELLAPVVAHGEREEDAE